MIHIIIHCWKPDGFLNWVCTKCGVHKQRNTGHPHQCMYTDKFGRMLGYNLPECKSTFHNDKML